MSASAFCFCHLLLLDCSQLRKLFWRICTCCKMRTLCATCFRWMLKNSQTNVNMETTNIHTSSSSCYACSHWNRKYFVVWCYDDVAECQKHLANIQWMDDRWCLNRIYRNTTIISFNNEFVNKCSRKKNSKHDNAARTFWSDELNAMNLDWYKSEIAYTVPVRAQHELVAFKYLQNEYDED